MKAMDAFELVSDFMSSFHMLDSDSRFSTWTSNQLHGMQLDGMTFSTRSNEMPKPRYRRYSSQYAINIVSTMDWFALQNVAFTCWNLHISGILYRRILEFTFQKFAYFVDFKICFFFVSSSFLCQLKSV